MSRYAKIEKRMWGDAKFCELSPMLPSGQSLFIYLLTGEFTGPIPGLYSAGRAAMAEALAWEIEDFEKQFAEVSQQGMVKADWKARLVWIPNAIRYNRPESPNVARYWAKELDNLPECDLKVDAVTALRQAIYQEGAAYGQAFDEVLAKSSSNSSVKALGNRLPKASPKAMANPEPEPEPEQEPVEVGGRSTGSQGPRGHATTAADAARVASPDGAATPASQAKFEKFKNQLTSNGVAHLAAAQSSGQIDTGSVQVLEAESDVRSTGDRAADPQSDDDSGHDRFALEPTGPQYANDESLGRRGNSVPVREVVSIYNKVCQALPGVEIVNKGRHLAVQSRWKELEGAGAIQDRRSGLEFFEKLFTYVQQNDFLTGRRAGRGGTPFRCNFDWIMGPKNFAKVIEGNYDQ